MNEEKNYWDYVDEDGRKETKREIVGNELKREGD